MQLAQRLVRRGVLKPEDLARVAEVQAATPTRRALSPPEDTCSWPNVSSAAAY
jgi:hypothetical protein